MRTEAESGQAVVGLVVVVPLVILVLLLGAHAGLRAAFASVEQTAKARADARERALGGTEPIRPRWQR